MTDERGQGTLLSDWNEDPWDSSIGVTAVEELRPTNKPVRSLVFIVIALGLCVVLAAGVYGWWYIGQANPAGEAQPVVQFTVQADDTPQTISERLEERGIIPNASFFRSYAADNGGGLDEVVPGLYLLSPGDHVGNTLGRLRTPPSETITRITFPEGFTLEQMAARLEANDDLPQFSAEEFLAAADDPSIVATLRPAGVTSMEGLLFPATYEVSNADSERQLIERMAAEMERVGSLVDISAPEVAGFTPYQILIIASIIEREAKTDRDRPLIARVIYNRLANGMPLEIDATLLYRVDPSTGIDPNNRQPGDIDRLAEIPGPYNTYLNLRLPPTPIANPGRESIEAALNPAPNPSAGEEVCDGVPAPCQYLYYVIADTQGNHSFWATAEQHAAAVQEAIDNDLL